jgi:1-acyl-sn-glycerol-3-phosphate acyltransferase
MLDNASQIARYTLVCALMVPLLGGALVVAPFSSLQARRMVRAWNKAFLSIFGVSFEVEFQGSPKQLEQGGVIVGLNQQSLFDPTVGFAAWDKPVNAILNIEYALIPFFGWVSFILGWVIVRQNPSQSKRQIAKAAKYAGDGGLVFLSAEGQRSFDGQLSPYKKGPVVMAITAQAPIHPIYIAGSRACLAPGTWKIRPGRITIRYLSPISTIGMTYEDRNVLLERLREVGEAAHSKWFEGGGSVA